MTQTVGIMANGPITYLPDLEQYKQDIDVWIGADQGALFLVDQGIRVHYAVGDFDSIEPEQRDKIQQKADVFEWYPAEKDETDMEIALNKALDVAPDQIYLFGVTGGRMDHTLINLQLLYSIVTKNMRGTIIDKGNQLEMKMPGTYQVKKSAMHPYISFIAYTKQVRNLTLEGFYYPLKHTDISWGSTLSISNELQADAGTFSFDEGVLLLVKSCDAPAHTLSI